MDWPEILTTVTTSVLTGVAVWLRDRRKERLLRAVPIVASAHLQQEKVLNALARELGAHQCLLLKAHNGGKIPHGGSTLKVTVVAEAEPPPGMARVRSEFQARPIDDSDYLRMLRDVDRQGFVLLKTEELKEGTMLGDEHRRAGIRSSWVMRVRAEPEQWYYLSCGSRHVMTPNAISRAVLRSTAAKLNHLCRPASRITTVDS
ncbi:MAG: hypothetical protein VYA51_13015 [Planctomycetota bacterium]|nr:hypothetical protein [Planctomycetota bacterium]